MHPPTFNLNDLLSDWPKCFLHIYCRCGRSTHYPIRLLIEKIGCQPFAAVLPRLRCESCGGGPAPVYLCAGHQHTRSSGGAPDWALELVGAPK